ncbi:MAG: hypothetical protein ACYC69_16915 [Thermodesulfovibrionales bacterium]
MDWLDEKLDEYDRQKAEERRSDAEEKKRREEENARRKRAATDALNRAHKKLEEVKKKLVDHKHLCDLSVVLLADSTGQKYPSEITLLVKNASLWGKETISKLNASSLVLAANLGSDEISVITKDERNQDAAPAITAIKIDLLTDALVDSIIKDFINQIFSN